MNATREAVNSETAVPAAAFQAFLLPKIGAWLPGQGGIYMGHMLDADGRECLLVLHETFLIEDVDQATAIELAAKATADGHEDFHLPDQSEAHQLYVNGRKFLKGLHWTSTSYAGVSSYAWYQSFGYGYQYGCHKDLKLRGCAVRRVYLPI